MCSKQEDFDVYLCGILIFGDLSDFTWLVSVLFNVSALLRWSNQSILTFEKGLLLDLVIFFYCYAISFG
jgi:hypothetical protein